VNKLKSDTVQKNHITDVGNMVIIVSSFQRRLESSLLIWKGIQSKHHFVEANKMVFMFIAQSEFASLLKKTSQKSKGN